MKQNNVKLIYIEDCFFKNSEEIIHIQLPKLGTRISKNEHIIYIETIYSIGSIVSEFGGVVIEINKRIHEIKSLLDFNEWVLKIELLK